MIIDTNVYSALDRADPVVLKMLTGAPMAYIPIIVLGELRYGFTKGSKALDNESRLKRFISLDTVETIYLTDQTAKVYGELSVLCSKKGRALSNNDIWIAALALENDMPLVTFDKDFAVFNDILGDNLIIL